MHTDEASGATPLAPRAGTHARHSLPQHRSVPRLVVPRIALGLTLWWPLGLGACAPASSDVSGSDDPSGPGPRFQAQKTHVGPDGIERDASGIPVDQPVPEEARRRIGEFLEAMVPPPLTETSDVHDAWLHRTRALLAELQTADESVGHAALHAFCGNATDYTVTRWALLRIGASTAPEAAAPLLRELMLQYGYRTDDRAEATLLYAEADPAGYLVDARPFVLRHERPRSTMPNDEFLVRGWIEACSRQGISAADVCADVATNLWMEPYARIVAVEALGRYGADPLARAALQTCLIESTGDGNLRRKAAQAIRDGWTREESCALLDDVLSKEVDLNFASFLTTLIHAHCTQSDGDPRDE